MTLPPKPTLTKTFTLLQVNQSCCNDLVICKHLIKRSGTHCHFSPPKLLSGHLVSTKETDLSKFCRGRLTQALFPLGRLHEHRNDLKPTQVPG